MKKLFLIFIFLSAFHKTKASCPFSFRSDSVICDTIIVPEGFANEQSLLRIDSLKAITGSDSVQIKKHPNNKLIASILAFPLPFGLLGLHRIYLGTKPYIPFVYIGTIGGCFGIMPLIDFIAIITSKKDSLPRYEKCHKVFMWAH